MARRIHFVSLGCAKNRVDTEVMLGVSDEQGFQLVADPAEADVIVVNTCGFITSAKEESIEAIVEMGQLKEQGACRTLVVAGCLSQRYADELALELPEVDHFLGSSDMLRLGEVLGGGSARMLVGDPANWLPRSSDPRRLSQSAFSAYLKIGEGCDRTCSFCAIPSIRGRQRSRSIDDLVLEARSLAESGVVELNLVSQDTIAYGRDQHDRPSLAKAVAALTEVEGIAWIRLHYLYPEKLDPALIELLADHPKVLPYIDMPLQHVSDPMLRRMRRGHGGERIYRVVDRLREALPELVFRSTFLVGHPGESESDFEELCKFVRWAELDHLGAFAYSEEEGTRSAEMDDAVAPEVAEERLAELMELQRPVSRARLRSRIGQEVDVLVEGLSEESELLLQGRTWGQAPEVDGVVLLANGEARPGTIRRALIRDAGDYDLVGDLIGADGSIDLPPGVDRPRRRKVRLRTLS